MFLLSGQPTIQLLNNFKLSLRILLHGRGLKYHGCDTMSLGVWLLAVQTIVVPSSAGKSSPRRKSLLLNCFILGEKGTMILWNVSNDPHNTTQHITLQDTWILSNTTVKTTNLGYCMGFQSSLNPQRSEPPWKRPITFLGYQFKFPICPHVRHSGSVGTLLLWVPSHTLQFF